MMVRQVYLHLEGHLDGVEGTSEGVEPLGSGQMRLSVKLWHHGVASVGTKGCVRFGRPYIRLRCPSQQDAQ